MLYLRFNLNNNFKYSLEKINDIEWKFLAKISEEFQLTTGIQNALWEEIGIPQDACQIDVKSVENLGAILEFIVLEYSKKPIDSLENKSLNDLGIDVEVIKYIPTSEVNANICQYFKKNNLQLFTEEVMWKNMTNEEKVKIFSDNFKKIKSKGKELIVIDPYIFSCNEEDYCYLLSGVFDSSESSDIIVITEKKNFKKNSFNKVKNKLKINIQVKYSSEFHDRFWIADRKKGFYTGTSFNGIGKKISLVNIIPDDDVKEILEELGKLHLLEELGKLHLI